MKRTTFMNEGTHRYRRNLDPLLPSKEKRIFSLSDTHLTKMDENGKVLWSNPTPGTGNRNDALFVRTDGYCIVAFDDGATYTDAYCVFDGFGNIVNTINNLASAMFASLGSTEKVIVLGQDSTTGGIRVRDISKIHIPKTEDSDAMPIKFSNPKLYGLGGLFSLDMEYLGFISMTGATPGDPPITLNLFDKNFVDNYGDIEITALGTAMATGGWVSNNHAYITYFDGAGGTHNLCRVGLSDGVVDWTYSDVALAIFIYGGTELSDGSCIIYCGDEPQPGTDGAFKRINASGVEVWERAIGNPTNALILDNGDCYAGDVNNTNLNCVDINNNLNTVVAPGTIIDIASVPWDSDKLVMRILGASDRDYMYSISGETFTVLNSLDQSLNDPIWFPPTDYIIAKEVFTPGTPPESNFSVY